MTGKEGTWKVSTSRTVPSSHGNRERFYSQGSWSGVGEKDQSCEHLAFFLSSAKSMVKASIRWLSNSLVPLRLSACDLFVLKHKTGTREQRGRKMPGAEYNSYGVRE